MSDARHKLSELNVQDLENTTDFGRKAFWTNIYNARVREKIKKDEVNLRSSSQRFKFFYLTKIEVCSRNLSLQTIEHRILRRGQLSFGLGYISIPSISAFVQRSRPDSLDYRIHFLLNCGAKSCPRVRILDADNYDKTASEATSSYLNQNVAVRENAIEIPRIFLWYRGDFGGRGGIVDILEDYTKCSVSPSDNLKYRDYDWSTNLSVFSES
jgi:hypothetical protein